MRNRMFSLSMGWRVRRSDERAGRQEHCRPGTAFRGDILAEKRHCLCISDMCTLLSFGLQLLCFNERGLCNFSVAQMFMCYASSQMFDLLGYDAETYKHWNKVNIHVGGTYGDKGESFRSCKPLWSQNWILLVTEVPHLTDCWLV